MASASQSNNIEEDERLVNQLLEAAKFGRWQEVWNIIGSPESPSQKVYLINAIPQNRRWGVIHQAVFWRDAAVVDKLLRFKACDKDMLTKPCTSENIGVTELLTPLALAEKYGYHDIAAVTRKYKTVEKNDMISTFRPHGTVHGSCGIRLLEVALALNKNAFHPTKINPSLTLAMILRNIWDEMNRSETRWEAIRDVVADSVYIVCTKRSKNIADCEDLKSLKDYIIKVYTEEENYMYTFLSTAFRRQTDVDYRPTSTDLALGPFAVVFQMLLLFWPDIPRHPGVTYRRMIMTKSDSEKYAKGVKFVWPAVVSSSAVKNYAVAFPTCDPSLYVGNQSVLFQIDNRQISHWMPKNIENYATYTEHERTYPAGAAFEVTGRSVQSGNILISLKLLAN